MLFSASALLAVLFYLLSFRRRQAMVATDPIWRRARPICMTTQLDQIRIASPCTVPWSAMDGDERMRRCGECRLDVYNVSDMTRDEALELVRERQGRLCVRLYRRPDGTVLTRDCPVGLRAWRWRVARRTAAAAALVTGLLAKLLFRNAPDPGYRHEMGMMMPPPPPAAE